MDAHIYADGVGVACGSYPSWLDDKENNEPAHKATHARNELVISAWWVHGCD